MAKNSTDENACQARTGTEEQQNPERVPGQTAAAAKALAEDAAAAKEAEAKGQGGDQGE